MTGMTELVVDAVAVRREAEQEVAAEAGVLEVVVAVVVLAAIVGLEAVSRAGVVGLDAPVELFPSARRIRYPSCFVLKI